MDNKNWVDNASRSDKYKGKDREKNVGSGVRLGVLEHFGNVQVRICHIMKNHDNNANVYSEDPIIGSKRQKECDQMVDDHLRKILEAVIDKNKKVQSIDII